MGNIINSHCMLHIKVVKTINPKSSLFLGTLFSISLILYLYEMIDFHETYCGNYFIMHVSQIIMLYT